MSNFMYTGQIGNFIFHPARVLVLHHPHSYAICKLYALYVHKIQHEGNHLVRCKIKETTHTGR